MSIFKERWEQFLEYLNFKKEESKIQNKFISKYKDKVKDKEEYERFKVSILDTINMLFNQGKSEVWLKPNRESIELYEQLMKDKEFTGTYNCAVKDGDKLSIKLVEI